MIIYIYIDLSISESGGLSKSEKEKALETFAMELCQQLYSAQGYKGEIKDKFVKPNKLPNLSKDFKELARKDKSFLKYLNEREIDVLKLDKYTEKDKRPTIRKIEYIVFIRNQYFNNKMKLKSLKSPLDYYANFSNLAKSLEYNPRMLIATINVLLSTLNDNSKKIKLHNQISAIKTSKETLKSLLNTIAISYSNSKTVSEFIHSIGEHFEEGIKGINFNAEPAGSFKTNKKISPKLREAIGLALNAGALIRVFNEDAEKSISIIENSRFRLSYIFAHRYALPLQLMKAIPISAIFKTDNFEGPKQLPLKNIA